MELTNEPLFLDIVEYSKLYPEICIDRMNYAAIELAVLWYKTRPETENEIKNYYRNNSELYLFDLTKYQLTITEDVRDMMRRLDELNPGKILEYGGGIGEFTIKATQKGFNCAYYELDGEIKDYALWRFKKHGVNPRIIPECENPLTEEWDLINIMDVLEHIKNPESVIWQLRAKNIFANPDMVKYNMAIPQHVGKYNLSGYSLKEMYHWVKDD